MAKKGFFSMENSLFKKLFIGYILFLVLETSVIYFADYTSKTQTGGIGSSLSGQGNLMELGFFGIFNNYFWILIISLIILFVLVILVIIFGKRKIKPNMNARGPQIQMPNNQNLANPIIPQAETVKQEQTKPIIIQQEDTPVMYSPGIIKPKSNVEKLLDDADFSLARDDIKRARDIYNILRVKYDAKLDPKKIIYNRIMSLYKRINK
jgi:hypothetical protein